MSRPNIQVESTLKRLAEKIRIVETEEPAAPACATCNDTGYVSYNVPTDDKRFGRLYPCTDPGCPIMNRHRRQQSDKVMQQSTWEDGYESLTFDSFHALMEGTAGWNGKRGAYAAAKAFAFSNNTQFTLQQAAQYALGLDWPGAEDRSSNSVVLTGDVGLGKTSCAVSSANALRNQNKVVVFARTLNLIDRVQETYREGWEGDTPDQRKRFFASVPYLILDEFGIKSYTNNRLEIIEDIIRERDRRGLPFMATTNLTLDQMRELWQPQIADIIAKAHWVEVAGVKLRQTTRKVESW